MKKGFIKILMLLTTFIFTISPVLGGEPVESKFIWEVTVEYPNGKKHPYPAPANESKDIHMGEGGWKCGCNPVTVDETDTYHIETRFFGCHRGESLVGTNTICMLDKKTKKVITNFGRLMLTTLDAKFTHKLSLTCE